MLQQDLYCQSVPSFPLGISRTFHRSFRLDAFGEKLGARLNEIFP